MLYLVMLVVMITALLAMSLGIRLTEVLERENRLVEAELESSGIYSEALRRKVGEARRYRHDATGLMQAIERQLALDAQAAQDGRHAPGSPGGPAAGGFPGEGASPGPHAQDSPRAGSAPATPASPASPAAASRTGLLLVDAILNLKEERCREKGIRLAIEAPHLAQAAGERGISEGDMASLLQNLLDNAIEESERVDDASRRLVHLHADASGGELRVRVENRTETSERPAFRTRKANPELHGLGTGIIDNIVHAHGGRREVEFDQVTRILAVTVSF